MDKNHTRKYLQVQGFHLDDDALAEIGPWMRWPYALCASILVTGVVLAGFAFFTGATTVGYVLGGVLAAMATLLAMTHICIPSFVYNAIVGTKPSEHARTTA